MSGPINHLSSDDLKCCIATSASASLSTSTLVVAIAAQRRVQNDGCVKAVAHARDRA